MTEGVELEGTARRRPRTLPQRPVRALDGTADELPADDDVLSGG